jgi:hypothetical protein
VYLIKINWQYALIMRTSDALSMHVHSPLGGMADGRPRSDCSLLRNACEHAFVESRIETLLANEKLAADEKDNRSCSNRLASRISCVAASHPSVFGRCKRSRQ